MNPGLTEESLYKELFFFIQNMTYLFPNIFMYIYTWLRKTLSSSVTSKFQLEDQHKVEMKRGMKRYLRSCASTNIGSISSLVSTHFQSVDIAMLEETFVRAIDRFVSVSNEIKVTVQPRVSTGMARRHGLRIETIGALSSLSFDYKA